MTNYCTVNDILDVLSEQDLKDLSDDYSRNVTLDDEQIAEFIEGIISKVESEVDVYLRGASYDVPLTTVPDIILNCVQNITRYRLFSRRNLPIPENVSDDKNEAMKTLEKIRKQELDLGLSASSETDYLLKINKTEDDVMFGKSTNSNASYNLDNYFS